MLQLSCTTNEVPAFLASGCIDLIYCDLVAKHMPFIGPRASASKWPKWLNVGRNG